MTITHGFELLETRDILELNTQAKLYRHVATGAELLSLENADENKAFTVAFRTPPLDSTGLPHIMEHSVLCGSRKYPVKEPFIELAKGSLNTFLNANVTQLTWEQENDSQARAAHPSSSRLPRSRQGYGASGRGLRGQCLAPRRGHIAGSC